MESYVDTILDALPSNVREFCSPRFIATMEIHDQLALAKFLNRKFKKEIVVPVHKDFRGEIIGNKGAFDIARQLDPPRTQTPVKENSYYDLLEIANRVTLAAFREFHMPDNEEHFDWHMFPDAAIPYKAKETP